MAKVWPFKGVQYNTSVVGDMSAVIAPPFDIINANMQAELHSRHEANVVRLELADEKKLHPGAADKYESARMFMEDWLKNSTLAKSDEPAIYLISQEFDHHGPHVRWGFICAVTLEPLDAGVVIPHEATLDKPKADRLKLISTCRTNLSPVFACYFDPDGGVKKTLAGVSNAAPQFSATDAEGIKIKVWKVTDKVVLDRLHKVMLDRQLFIADGHHRYESSLNYRNIMREQNPGAPEDAPFNRIMIYLSDFEDSNLLALPIHRVIRHLKGWTPSEFLKKLSKSFDYEKAEGDWAKSPEKSLDALLDVMAKRADERPIGMILKDDPAPYILIARNEAVDGITNIPELLKNLDVSRLHRLALDEILGIREKDLRDGEIIVYDHEPSAALDRVRSGGWSAAFFLNRIKVGDIRDVCSSGLRMHQKSTYFYPKIPSGLVFHALY